MAIFVSSTNEYEVVLLTIKTRKLVERALG